MKAFPKPFSGCADSNRGMDLRDYFAAAAMTGICAHLGGAAQKGNETIYEAHARWAYLAADAMMKARKQ